MTLRHAAALAPVGWYLVVPPVALAFHGHHMGGVPLLGHVDLKNKTFDWGMQDYLGFAILLLVIVGLSRGMNPLHLLRELRKMVRKSK
jgi:hypothetical protein